MQVLPLIVDCDPGIDDAIALFSALGGPEAVEVIAVTTVGGNRPVEETTTNALRLLDLAGRSDIPVHQGCGKALNGEGFGENTFHGQDGLGDCGVPPPVTKPGPGHAVDAIIAAARRLPPGTLALAALGPLTNIATALERAPWLSEHLASISVMGGDFDLTGGSDADPEFNFRLDPDAAAFVLASGAPLTLFGLNVTRQAPIAPHIVGSLPALGEPFALVRRMLEFYGAKDPAIHDLCATAWLVRPSIFGVTTESVAVETSPRHIAGRCRIGGSGPRHRVVTDVDKEGLLTLALQSLRALSATGAAP